jgi:O-antigen ligase
MANQEWLDRLSGAPSDVINPNGLAFVICTVLPFLYFLQGTSWVNRLAFLCFTPAGLYALALTGSRTGFVTLIVIFLSILVKSRQRALIAVAGVLIFIIGLSALSPDQQDRYLSLFGLGEKNTVTVDGRIEGVKSNFAVTLRKPVFGHGLGTSLEANANFGHSAQRSHNLIAEVAQELGYVGLVLFLLFIKAIFSQFSEYQRRFAGGQGEGFLPRILDAMQVWLWTMLIASLATYGLTSYEWYLFAGFSVVMRRLSVHASSAKSPSSKAWG